MTRRLTFFFFLFSIVGFANPECETQGEIEKALSCVPGLTFKEISKTEDPKIPEGYRRFEMQFTQPVDHARPDATKFNQRLVLFHKSQKEPMVLQTSGYSIFTVALTQLATDFGTNQIQVEHRFFDQSAPSVLNWSKLDIFQSANDFHRITQEFRKIYRTAWVNTGASKGGMTSVYHRRFFPKDLDGTVADVAPHSYATEDPRYITFVDEVGGKTYAECRRKLEALQISLLQNRIEALSHIAGSYLYLGGKSVAFEHAVIEMPFTFWQYKTPTDGKVGCDKIPDESASIKEQVAYLNEVNEVSNYGDTDLFKFMPYYFQAATQLGGPASQLKHLDGLKLHPYNLGQYTPHNVSINYSNQSMIDVAHWVKSEATNIVFVYGEFDPWSAAAFPLGNQTKDLHRFIVPGGNHGSKYFKLSAADKSAAKAIFSTWFKKQSISETETDSFDSLDEKEFRIRSSMRLPARVP